MFSFSSNRGQGQVSDGAATSTESAEISGEDGGTSGSEKEQDETA